MRRTSGAIGGGLIGPIVRTIAEDATEWAAPKLVKGTVSASSVSGAGNSIAALAVSLSKALGPGGTRSFMMTQARDDGTTVTVPVTLKDPGEVPVPTGPIVLSSDYKYVSNNPSGTSSAIRGLATVEGAPTLIVVHSAYAFNNAAPTSVTFNGMVASKVVEAADDAGAHVSIWKIDAADAAAANLQVTFADSPAFLGASVHCLSADFTVADVDAFAWSNPMSEYTQTVDVPDGGLVFLVGTGRGPQNPPTVTFGSGEDVGYSRLASLGNYVSHICHSRPYTTAVAGETTELDWGAETVFGGGMITLALGLVV